LSKDQILSLAQAIGLGAHENNQAALFKKTKSEIGNVELSDREIKAVEKSLADAPPVPFDLQRQVRVFQPYIQYVELKLEGASLKRQTVSLPPSLAPLAKNEQVQKRLRTTYSLLGEKSKLDDTPLHDELNLIRKDFTRHIPTLNGSVMIRGKEADLDKRFEVLKAKVEKHKEVVKLRLQKEIDTSLTQLKNAILPLVLRTPPSSLVNGCLGSKPTKDEADRWLQSELEKTFPKVETVLRDIELSKTYKGVTYSNLNIEGLRNELKSAFPAIGWDRPFEEFNTARQTEDEKGISA
jgi:hypothetical protein